MQVLHKVAEHLVWENDVKYQKIKGAGKPAKHRYLLVQKEKDKKNDTS